MMVPKWYHRPLSGGEVGSDVTVVNRKLGVPEWTYGETSIQYVRGLQHTNRLPVTGVLGATEATILGEAADHELPPEWFSRPLSAGDSGPDVAHLRGRLGLPSGDVFDDATRRAVLRFQSSHSLGLTGQVDDALARLIP